MTVVCKVDGCPYKSEKNFCKKNFLSLNNRGQCMQIYDKFGNVKMNWQKQEKEGNENDS